MNKKKILVLSHLFPNSQNPQFGIFVFNRLQAVNRYCELRIVAPVARFPFMGMFRRYKMHSKIPRHEMYRGLDVLHPHFPIIPKYLKFLDSFSLLLSTFTSIFRLKKKFSFDLIDMHWTYPEILTGAFWAFWLKCGYIVTIRGNEALYASDHGIRRFVLNYFLRRAHAVITLSSQLKERVREIGVAADKIHVVLNGVNVDEFKLSDKFEARERLSLPQDSFILLSVGSLILTKGHQHLIELMPSLGKDFSVELFVIGGVGPAGDDLDRLTALISRLGLNNVHLIGMKPHEELVHWYNAADMFCLASEGEGCPNVVVEAMASGTPVIVTDVGAVRDLVDTDTKGYVVPCGDLQALEMAIRQSFVRSWDRHAIWASMQDMNWDGCAKSVVNIYERVLQD